MTTIYLGLLLMCLSYILRNSFSSRTIEQQHVKRTLTSRAGDYTVGGYDPGVHRNYGVCQKGGQPWDREQLRRELPKFLQIYEHRPGENFQGTPMMHQFALWCIIRQLRPRHIIESGVWNGRGTWLLRQAAPDAQIIVLDPEPRKPMKYVDNRTDTIYFMRDKFRDFGTISNWSDVTLDLERTLAFIDDHQTPFKRIPQARAAGIRHLVFEDNYWLGYADCLSLKQACACLMREPECRQFKYRDNWSQVVRPITGDDMQHIAKTFGQIETYIEFPAIWNVYSKSVTMVSKRSRNYLYNTSSGINLVKYLGLKTMPPWIQFNGFYSYCNIAYVKL